VNGKLRATIIALKSDDKETVQAGAQTLLQNGLRAKLLSRLFWCGAYVIL